MERQHHCEAYLEEGEPWPSRLVNLEDIRAIDRDIYHAMIEQMVDDEEEYGTGQ